ncbi:transposase family protein [Streptomyces sp. NPDC001093]|uniref:transposase family protein n=1 Tax=Streptomyces sp. NPDC001093 TaxID=3154376 RepID=UPI00331E0FF8
MFVDRVLVTLVHLRHGLPHAALAVLFGVDRSTVSGAIRQVRPLLAARGCAVPDRPGIRLRTLEDVFAYAEAEGVEVRLDGTDVQVRRPKVGRPGRKAFVSGKRRQNTIKTPTFSDEQGRLVFSGVPRPGRMPDQTAVRTEGIAEQLRCRPGVKAHVDEGYRGLANEFPNQVTAPPRKVKDDAPIGEQHAWRHARRSQSSARICVNTPTPSSSNGSCCAGTPVATTTSPRPRPPSPAWSPTGQPAAQHAARRARNLSHSPTAT